MRAHHHQAISRQLQTDKEILLRSRMWCAVALAAGEVANPCSLFPQLLPSSGDWWAIFVENQR